MIDSKQELNRYLLADEIARWGKKTSWMQKLKKGDLWKYHVTLRKLEYSINCRRGLWGKACTLFHKMRLKHYSKSTGWTIPPNTVGEGLLVVHRGTVVISPKCKIGANCRIHVCVNIGAWDGGAPQIGNNVYIGPGAKIFGNIEIADDIAIGANAVVNHSFCERGISIAGVPAVKISDKGNKYRVLGKRFEES